MALLKPVRQELPSRDYTDPKNALMTEKQAREFFDDIAEGAGEWMKYFEADFADNLSKDGALRSQGLQFAQCSAMKQYRNRIDVTSRKVGTKIICFARVKV